jgi:hypothetical protein
MRAIRLGSRRGRCARGSGLERMRSTTAISLALTLGLSACGSGRSISASTSIKEEVLPTTTIPSGTPAYRGHEMSDHEASAVYRGLLKSLKQPGTIITHRLMRPTSVTPAQFASAVRGYAAADEAFRRGLHSHVWPEAIVPFIKMSYDYSGSVVRDLRASERGSSASRNAALERALAAEAGQYGTGQVILNELGH